jgi:glycosyltransferase involved in cell wall biosynthesis
LEQESPFVIAWTGSGSTLAHLEAARAAIERFGRKRKTVMVVICSRPPARAFDGVETQFVPWSAETEAAGLGRSHVGIMPLPDNEYTRGKGGYKALLYMAVGRPAVLSPVGVNTEIIRHGSNGMLARSTDEWVGALDALADSRALRYRLARAGRLTVENRYSAKSGADAFAGVVKAVLANRNVAAQHDDGR